MATVLPQATENGCWIRGPADASTTAARKLTDGAALVVARFHAQPHFQFLELVGVFLVRGVDMLGFSDELEPVVALHSLVAELPLELGQRRAIHNQQLVL